MIDKHETNKYLKRLHALGYTLAPLGVEFRKDNKPYFCTPKYSNIIGWAGGTEYTSAAYSAIRTRCLR